MRTGGLKKIAFEEVWRQHHFALKRQTVRGFQTNRRNDVTRRCFQINLLLATNEKKVTRRKRNFASVDPRLINIELFFFLSLSKTATPEKGCIRSKELRNRLQLRKRLLFPGKQAVSLWASLHFWHCLQTRNLNEKIDREIERERKRESSVVLTAFYLTSFTSLCLFSSTREIYCRLWELIVDGIMNQRVFAGG